MTPHPIICHNITKSFGPVQAVAGADLVAPGGELLALLGPSGCGKTTLLRLVAGFETPDGGTIAVGDRLLSGGRVEVPPEQRRVGMVFQDYALFPHLSVSQNVAYGLSRGAERERRVADLLELVGLGGLAARMPHQLSGGQQQRAALARALAPRPDVLLLDEPFSNLDAGLRRSVRAEVRGILRAAGVTALFVTHDQEEALSLADQVAVMLDGRIAQVGPPSAIYLRPVSRAVASFVGEATFVAAEASGALAHSPLGPLALASPATGPVELLLRPETLALTPDPAGPHIVVGRTFFGPSQVAEVRLADGTPVAVRLLPWDEVAPGQRVSLHALQPVVAFEAR